MKYYAYYRCSTSSQIEKNGIQMQESVVMKYAEENGIDIEGSFKDEGISGTKPDRPGIMDLISACEDGDTILVQNTSRLWRGTMTQGLLLSEFNKHHLKVISIEQPNYEINMDMNNEKANEFFIMGIMDLLDIYDRMQIALKLSKGRRAKARKGGKSCGNCPIGYMWKGQDVFPDPEYEGIVKFIFEDFCRSKNYSLTARNANRRGYRSIRGSQFSAQAIKRIIENDFYIGVITYGNVKYSGNHDPIIDEEIFRAANKIA